MLLNVTYNSPTERNSRRNQEEKAHPIHKCYCFIVHGNLWSAAARRRFVIIESRLTTSKEETALF
ncbi:MAG TPA: hypothetical protein VFH91_08740, partial [Pyrinomonadaceae bacterium]|nr:hypothetical protein [Pyrinomonadaceae bacterium]